MSAYEFEQRPPFIKFEYMPIEDREASIRTGMYSTKDVVFVIVTPRGSKDRMIKVASDWLEQQAYEVKQGRLDPLWLKYYRDAHKAFIDGAEEPVTGRALKVWGAITPSQLNNCLQIGLKTIEDLAAADEGTVARLGMGGRALVEKAKSYIKTNSSGTSAVAAENQELRSQLMASQAQAEQQAATIARLSDQLELLLARVSGGTPEAASDASDEDILKEI